MMFIFYDLAYILVFLFWYMPLYIFKRKFHRDFWMRLGIFPARIRDKLAGQRPIWLHAVSVGEVLASKQLLEGLHKEYPDKQVVISTVTATGNKVAQGISGENDIVIYLPLDISFIAGLAVKLINPSVVVIAETEIWPNFIRCLNRRGVPIITVNARISDGSFKGYRLARFLIGPILNKINIFCAQTGTDADRLRALGVEEAKIKVTGNMKFDSADYADYKNDYTDLRQKLALRQGDKLLVAGSTHRGEEDIILNVYKNLAKEFPGLRLLIAPRHPERSKEIECMAEKYGFVPLGISRLNSSTPQLLNSRNIFILDVMGRLAYFYAIADIVFVGKSLVKKGGGQNILEPASFARPILFGPHMFNFREIANLYLNRQAAVLVKDGEELSRKIRFLLNNPLEADRLGQKAMGLLLENKGASLRNLEAIKTLCKFTQNPYHRNQR